MAAQHQWILGGTRRDRERRLASLPAPWLVVDAHRRLRGPYTFAGTVLRATVPAAIGRALEHDVEILAAAPELHGVVPATRETLTSLAAPAERTRYYSRARTTRIAHGITEFVRDVVAGAAGSGPRLLVVENAEHADTTDVEVLVAMLRRIDPEVLTIAVCSAGPVAGELADVLAADVLAADVLAEQAVRPAPEPAPADADRARRYVCGDCVSDEPALRAAYEALGPADRAALHDARAAELERRDEMSLRLGAIPFHRELGADPAGAGADALRVAIDHCSLMGFYDATVELATRARGLVGWDRETERNTVNSRLAVALLMLARPAEAEALYDEARLHSTSPTVHMRAAYMTAMVYTRFYPPESRREDVARRWINAALAIASLHADPADRAFQSVFNQNGLALIEVRAGNLREALRLVDDGLSRLDRELERGDHRLHRSVLRYNRGQVCVALGLLDEALADYTSVIGDDPNYSEYYFDRANVLRRLGRTDEAMADYDAAIRLSPPYPEVYYNRGDLRAQEGDLAGGLADLDYVLELDPGFLAAYVNRAGLLADAGQYSDARRDVESGLRIDPDSAELRCLLGELETAAGRVAAALAAYGAAVAVDPGLAGAWAARGAVRFEAGDLDGARTDLDRALELGDDAVVRFNRATVHAATGRWADAVADLDRALELSPDDADLRVERERCLAQLATA
jgi:tetratricopeptide (TPR) repeat protein